MRKKRLGTMRYFRAVGHYPDGKTHIILLKGRGGGPGTHVRSFEKPPSGGRQIDIPISDVEEISIDAYYLELADQMRSWGWDPEAGDCCGMD